MQYAFQIHFVGRTLLAASVLLVASCGGGGGGDSGQGQGAAEPQPQSGWVLGQFLPAESFAAKCASPRSGIDPATNQSYPDVLGSVLDENNWLRSWSNDLYLWYDEIVDRDPGSFDDPLEYFELLKTNAVNSSGNPKDRVHGTFDSAEWFALSESGIVAGYGASFAIVSSLPPREVIVAYTQPTSPATSAGLTRGARIIGVDGVDLVSDGTSVGADVLNAGLFPATAGETHTFEVIDLGSAEPRTVELVSEQVSTDPVQNVSTAESPSGAVVGYMLFNDHIATAELELVEAVEQLAEANIEDLVIDIRYNGGGFLYIASELAYMIAGPVPTSGRVFEEFQFNDKHPTTNPVTGEPLEPLPFYNAYQVTATSPILPLPTLNLPRVFVLTGATTCSASESIMNSLRGVGVEVIQIGSQTCGKPYGFYPTDNCGTTYFSIQFQGVNDAGFGDYSDGFAPSGSSLSTDTLIPGCAVADDFDNELGSPAEALFAAALRFRDAPICSLALSEGEVDAAGPRESSGTMLQNGYVPKPPSLTNRIMGR